MKKTFREYSLKKINFKTLFFLIIFPLVLLACKADEIEVSIKSNDLKKVISGNTVSVGFEAELNMMAENNSETKAQIRAIEKIIDKYIIVEEYDVTAGDFGFKIKIEGELPLIYSPDGSMIQSVSSPWAMVISDNRGRGILSEFPYKLMFSSTSQFDPFSGELNRINLLLSPDRRQPIKLKLRRTGQDKLRIFTGSVEVFGESHVLYEASIEKRVSLTMKGGVYDRTPQVILFSMK